MTGSLNPKRARWHLHFTPTSTSWGNLVEGWFSILTRRALKQASFTSVTQLEAAIAARQPELACGDSLPERAGELKVRRRHLMPGQQAQAAAAVAALVDNL